LSAINRTLKVVLVITISCLAIPATQGQGPKSDISTVIAAGKVNGDTYTNTYFGISLTVPKAHFISSSELKTAGRAANLVQVVSDAPQGAENYTVTIRANSRENYPKEMTITDYVGRVRREMEKEGLEIKSDGVQVVISGVRFTGVVVVVLERPNFGYYRGIYSGFKNGYAVSFDVQCRKEEHLQEILSSSVKIYPN
jgi:hypothetical protein